MKVEALNCPNCGAAVSSDAVQCRFCNSRLKTMACPACLALMFLGSRHCPGCGIRAIQPEIKDAENPGGCPRCKIKLNRLQIDKISLRECRRCEGWWADVETFENVCAERESQAAILNLITAKHHHAENKNSVKVSYVPCPDCKQLMNRSNFARSSGVIIDLCKQHGVWFDREELPKIIEFVCQGGLDHARRKEKLQIEDERNQLRREQRQLAYEQNDFSEPASNRDSFSSLAVREFVRILFD